MLLSMCIALFKVYALPYPKGQWEMDCPVFLTAYAFLQYARITSGMKGNRVESRSSTLFMIFITAFSIFCNAFFIKMQTYTFVIEVVLHAVAIGFAGLECLMGAICIAFFFRDN
jgi:hypothetical protein